MKKISRILAAAFISICSLSSCVEEMAPVAGGDIQLSETIRIRATIDNDTRTKVALGESAEGVTKVEWTENDSFVLTVNQQDYTFVRVGDISSTEAEFAYDGQHGTFPQSFSAGTLTASYPATAPESYAIQTGTESGIGAYMTMAAEIVVEEGQSIHDITVSFRHTSSVVRATLTDPAFAEKDVVVTLTADGLLESGKTIRTSELRADGNGTVTAYIGVPVEGESLQLTNCTITASVNDVPFRATLGDKAFASGKIYKVAKSDLQLIEYEVATDLSADGTANSYIVSESGAYKFKAVKGNSNESVEAADVKVLWESFGTNVTPSVGDLVSDAQYNDGYISFNASSRKGNAVIAAVNSADKILWSWHIWLTDQPEEHEYFNNAGTMMDRNLGATSATPGDVGALGLMYQWGRKDPFLGSSSISEGVIAASTITWPSYVSSDASNGTIEYATANPTTFIGYNSINFDWQYNQDNTRWQSEKTVYDPCPAGWRVPDGGEDGVWSRTGGISPNCTYDSTNQGMNLSGKLGDASTIWYPASGHRDLCDGSLYNVRFFGTYWSASPNNSSTYTLFFTLGGDLYTTSGSDRAYGQPVRCIAE